MARNVLFIMCDQLRTDYLSCYGGCVPTPNIDRLAAGGVRFDRAYVTSGVCGPSRTSFYTGRYPISHRVTWNRVPLPLDELTLGDYLAEAGLPLHLLGKTHFVPDTRGLRRHFQARPGQQRFLDEGGFTPVERYDGHFEPAEGSPYRRYLLERGYRSEQPWTDFVIGSKAPDGSVASGWYLRNASLPAQVEARDSETAYLTSRAIDYVEQQGERPWVLHLSYIKPHWPFKAPAPYHAMFGAADAPRPVRSAGEREDPHPVFGAYQRLEESESFARDEVVDTVRPVYMGLVKQIDDEIGRLMARLEELGRLDDTLIVFTSDHGDLAGDHWLGEKEYFYEPVMKVPLIVRDPHAAADATRGTASDRLVECIDIVPSILEFLELPAQEHRVEGRSLIGLVRGRAPAEWRSCVFGHLDYAFREARQFLGRGPLECNGFMVRNERYKYVWWQGYRPQLFDLAEDPQELLDRGEDAALEPVRRALHDELLQWLAAARRRATESVQQVVDRTHAHEKMMGILIGRW
ncbi:MAG TPA: sulfatase-like hydrolase/transferase [Ramlibacter sp.]|nr:sulfatase-like hydrolase/transferase [Ramlibacter sp.]